MPSSRDCLIVSRHVSVVALVRICAATAEHLMLKNIIWDVDGTLFDTYPGFARAFHLALTDLGRKTPLPRIEQLARESLGACIQGLADEHGLGPGEIEARFVVHYAALKPQDEPPFPGAATMIYLPGRT
jgi:phosphoglycolate phosphatase-like HAD superfamily hydrolase